MMLVVAASLLRKSWYVPGFGVLFFSATEFVMGSECWVGVFGAASGSVVLGLRFRSGMGDAVSASVGLGVCAGSGVCDATSASGAFGVGPGSAALVGVDRPWFCLCVRVWEAPQELIAPLSPIRITMQASLFR